MLRRHAGCFEDAEKWHFRAQEGVLEKVMSKLSSEEQVEINQKYVPEISPSPGKQPTDPPASLR